MAYNRTPYRHVNRSTGFKPALSEESLSLSELSELGPPLLVALFRGGGGARRLLRLATDCDCGFPSLGLKNVSSTCAQTSAMVRDGRRYNVSSF